MKPLWAPWRLQYVKDTRDIACPFCVEASDSSLWLYSGEFASVILNRFPYANGHALIAPRRHVAEYTALNAEEAQEIHVLTNACIQVLRDWMHPHGINLGYNLGEAAGAGIGAHLHRHVVPRWSGDVNFMPVLAEVKVIPEHIEATATLFKQKLEAIL